jgi:predicted nucleic acid-binding protein
VTVFVDTSALFALLDRHDLRHREAVSIVAALGTGRRLVTTSYVAIESIALTDRRLGPAASLMLVDDVLSAIDIVWVDASLHAAGLAEYRRSPGQASLVDHVSFELMRREGIEEALAFDHDFEARGYAMPVTGEPSRPDPSDPAGELVGVSEIARRVQVRPDTVHKWRMRHAGFPSPIADLAAGPVWRWDDVRDWHERPRTTRRSVLG